ncbi:MAG TPA: class I SAM-dependent methyltransferase [Streptosporangiaceae bacterium]|nr:class I SAM-dependent methyltransferase [Streptosporangiaceae bacterium]
MGHPIRVSGIDLSAQVEQLRRHFPDIHRRVDLARVESWQSELAKNGLGKDDFGAEEAGGRGGDYVRAQLQNVGARAHGIRQLVDLIRRGRLGRQTIVDLLGGDGLVQRVCAMLGFTDVEVMTCDASPHMVETAWRAGIPALLQRAERQLFRSGSVDGVLLAYGTHHIPVDMRRLAAEEAYRVLRPGGTFVLHDFLTGSPTDIWFSMIVDPYSTTGHQYEHFTDDEIQEHLIKAGFESYQVREVNDPYMATGRTREEAEIELGKYLVNMYGLNRAREAFGDLRAFRWAADKAQSIFNYPDANGTFKKSTMEYLDDQGLWRFTIPRIALVGVGRKM